VTGVVLVLSSNIQMKSIFMKLNYPVFLLSFAIGIFIVYISSPTKKVVIKYPTPHTSMEDQYKDDSGNCYTYKAKEVECTGAEKTLPVQ
jgi:hypothetical protein